MLWSTRSGPVAEGRTQGSTTLRVRLGYWLGRGQVRFYRTMWFVLVVVSCSVSFYLYRRVDRFLFFKTCILVYDCISRARRGHVEGTSRAHRGRSSKKKSEIFPSTCGKKWTVFFFFSGPFFSFFSLYLN